jgi:hypothetical protein
MGLLIIALIAVSSFTCAAMGGRVAHLKRRRLAEGVGLGLVLGPLGLLIEGRMPATRRPEVDPAVRRSFLAMTRHPRRGDAYPDARGELVGP